jgi:hypothetical protein
LVANRGIASRLAVVLQPARTQGQAPRNGLHDRDAEFKGVSPSFLAFALLFPLPEQTNCFVEPGRGTIFLPHASHGGIGGRVEWIVVRSRVPVFHMYTTAPRTFTLTRTPARAAAVWIDERTPRGAWPLWKNSFKT